MKKTIKRMGICLLCALCIIGAVMPCCAAEVSGKITVLLEDNEKNRIDAATVHVCRIAGLDNTGYFPADGFMNAGISIAGIINNPSESAAKDVANYITENGIASQSATPSNGIVTFPDLEKGIWLVFCDENSRFVFNPYFVFLPYEAGGELHYEVSSAPKTEDSKPNLCNVYVIKRWDDRNNAAKKRPLSITVELLDGNTVISSAVLDEQNGWAYTFSEVAKEGDYSVREKPVTDYKAQYDGDFQNGFVITNSYEGEKLPQTGQHWWPIFLAAVAGVGFILLGIIELGARKNGKKEA